MTENTALWDKLGKTDPDHTKPFKRAGGFTGTAIKPMWSYKRMTEEFGPCGTGWGVLDPQFQLVNAGEEILVYCTVAVWHGGPHQTVMGVGGDKVLSKGKFGLVSDDEAYKKAYTDAVTNALKMIGVGADVHMGLFDDNKYINTVKEEFAEEERVKEKTRSSAEMKREGVWEKTMADLASDLVDVTTSAALANLRNQYMNMADAENWKPAWREALLDRIEAHETEIVKNGLWAELGEIKTLTGLQSFWQENLPVIKTFGKATLDEFVAVKDRMKFTMTAKETTLAAG